MEVATMVTNNFQACIDACNRCAQICDVCARECDMFKDEHCHKCAEEELLPVFYLFLPA